MDCYDITKIIEREKKWSSTGKIDWLLKTGTTFANVNKELLTKIKQRKQNGNHR